MTGDSRLGMSITHRRYIPHSHAHYGGSLVDGAYVLGLFGDVATDLGIHSDGDEGLFASYSDVQFIDAVRGGDVVEVTATIVRVGKRSRDVEFVARVMARSTPDVSESAASPLTPPLVCTTAKGTVVVP